MAVLFGYKGYIGYREMTNTTTEVNTVPSEFIFADNYSFISEQEEQLLPELGGVSARGTRRRQVGNITATGSLTRNIDPNNGISLYKHLLAGSVTSASIGSSTFSHTFTEGEEVDGSNTARLQFETASGGDSATSLRWSNGVVESYTLNVTVNELAKETWNFKFSDHGGAINTQATTSFTQTNPINFNRCTLLLGETITAVSVVATRDFTLNVNNNMNEDRNLGSNTVERFDFGTKAIDGNFNIVFENLTLYNRFRNNTATAIQITLESDDVTSTTQHSIVMKLAQCHFNGQTHEVGELGEIIQPINFTAIYGSNAGYMMQVVVTNTETTIQL